MSALPGLLIALVLVLVISQYLKILWMARKLPPGPMPFPLTGTLWQMRFDFSYETLITSLVERARRGGGSGLYIQDGRSQGRTAHVRSSFRLGTRRREVVSLQLLDRGLLRLDECRVPLWGPTGGHLAEPASLSLVERARRGGGSGLYIQDGRSQGIIFASGNVWKQHRLIGAMGLKFLSQGKSGLEHQIQEEALHLIEVFDSTKGQPMEPSFHIVLAVSNVICALLFGYRFSKDDETFRQLIKSTEFILQTGGSIWQTVYDIFPWIMNHLPGHHQRTFACYDFSISFAMKEIRSHEKSGMLDDPQNFIDFYLAQMAKVSEPVWEKTWPEWNFFSSSPTC